MVLRDGATKQHHRGVDKAPVVAADRVAREYSLVYARALSERRIIGFEGEEITQDVSTLENPAILEQLKQTL